LSLYTKGELPKENGNTIGVNFESK